MLLHPIGFGTLRCPLSLEPHFILHSITINHAVSSDFSLKPLSLKPHLGNFTPSHWSDLSPKMSLPGSTFNFTLNHWLDLSCQMPPLTETTLNSTINHWLYSSYQMSPITGTTLNSTLNHWLNSSSDVPSHCSPLNFKHNHCLPCCFIWSCIVY